MAFDPDQANRLAWGSSDVIKLFATRAGFASDAEAHVMRRLAAEANDQPILDIGVGGGRTVPLLRIVSSDYVGIDYIDGLVRAARRRYPDARLRCLDARNLSAFADETFGLVVFSRNGIDGVPHDDRARILREVHRVLRPGGLFAYSTQNLDHRRSDPRPDWRRIVGQPLRTLKQAARLPKALADYRRLRGLNAVGDGWASDATLGYGFAVIWHRVSLVEALRELGEQGFESVEVYGPSGLIATIERSDPTSNELDTRALPALHLVARKR
jgi:SAM-dependent methyltransferase